MAWIESHQRLLNDPEMLRLAGEMNWSVPECIGRLHMFWWWCVDHAETGDLRRCNDAVLALAVGLNPGDGKRFVDAMVGQDGQGFIERQPYFRIRNWWKFHGYRLAKKYAKLPAKVESIRKLYQDEQVHSIPETGIKPVDSIPAAGHPQVSSVPETGSLPVHSAPQPTEPTETNISLGASGQKRTKPKFQPPSLAEVSLLCAKSGLPEIEAQKFIAHHEARGWMLKTGQMRSWTAAFSTWRLNYEEQRFTRPMGNGHALNGKPSVGPTLKEVTAYAGEKGDLHDVAAYVTSWHDFWRKRDWKRKDGSLIDWKIELSTALAKRKAATTV